MPTEGLKARHGVALRAISGALTAIDRPLPLVNLGGFRRATIHIVQEAVLTLPDGDDEVNFFIDTAYGQGAFAASGELLTADIDDTQTTVGVDDTTTFVVGDVIQVGTEIMLVTATDGAVPGNLTADRAQRGSARAAHLNNAVVNLLDVNWVNVALVAYPTADDGTAPVAVITIAGQWDATALLNDIQADLGAEGVRALPLGDRLRLRVAVAGATAPGYNYSARVSLSN